MTYSKMTTISGVKAGYTAPTADPLTEERYAQVKANEPFNYCTVLRGHWKPESALSHARRAGVVGPVEVIHSTGDLSGHGRGGYDAAWVAEEGNIRRRELTKYEKEYDDADDVNELWDELEYDPH